MCQPLVSHTDVQQLHRNKNGLMSINQVLKLNHNLVNCNTFLRVQMCGVQKCIGFFSAQIYFQIDTLHPDAI